MFDVINYSEVIIFDPSTKLSCLDHFLVIIFGVFQNQAEQAEARSSGSFSEFRSGSPNRKSLGHGRFTGPCHGELMYVHWPGLLKKRYGLHLHGCFQK